MVQLSLPATDNTRSSCLNYCELCIRLSKLFIYCTVTAVYYYLPLVSTVDTASSCSPTSTQQQQSDTVRMSQCGTCCEW